MEMFTGIVEEIGTVERAQHGQHSAVLTIRAQKVLEQTKIGDSIAVNGICLTVTQLLDGKFSADVMHETLNRSALAQLGHGAMSIWNGPWRQTGGSAGISWRGMQTASGRCLAQSVMIRLSGIRLGPGRRFCGISWKRALSR